MTPLDEVKFALQILEDARRILCCNPHDQLTCEVYTADYPLVEVRPTPFLDPGTVLLIDPNAADAELREVLQHERPRFYEIPQQPFPDLTRWYRCWNPDFWRPTP